MNVAHPVESLIPGAPGRLLAALARVDAELPVSRLAAVAGVGRTRASAVLGELAVLGVVSRRQVGPTALVRLNRENMIGSMVAELGDAQHRAAERLRALAMKIRPQPVSLTLYGSFARGTATASSDIDILAVRPGDAEEDEWAGSLTNFSLAAEAITGNKVHILDYDVSDLRDRYPAGREDAGGQFWHSVTDDAITLAGVRLQELVGVNRDAGGQKARSEQGRRSRLPDEGAQLARCRNGKPGGRTLGGSRGSLLPASWSEPRNCLPCNAVTRLAEGGCCKPDRRSRASEYLAGIR